MIEEWLETNNMFGKSHLDNGDLTVAVRLRPLFSAKWNIGSPEFGSDIVVSAHGPATVSIRSPDDGAAEKYSFDHVFNSTDATSPDYVDQHAVWRRIGRPLLHKAADGFDVSFIGFGPSSGGKSYTLFGNNGIFSQVAKRVFDLHKIPHNAPAPSVPATSADPVAASAFASSAKSHTKRTQAAFNAPLLSAKSHGPDGLHGGGGGKVVAVHLSLMLIHMEKAYDLLDPSPEALLRPLPIQRSFSAPRPPSTRPHLSLPGQISPPPGSPGSPGVPTGSAERKAACRYLARGLVRLRMHGEEDLIAAYEKAAARRIGEASLAAAAPHTLLTLYITRSSKGAQHLETDAPRGGRGGRDRSGRQVYVTKINFVDLAPVDSVARSVGSPSSGPSTSGGGDRGPLHHSIRALIALIRETSKRKRRAAVRAFAAQSAHPHSPSARCSSVPPGVLPIELERLPAADSCLTRLLYDSLGCGRATAAVTCMLVCVSPSSHSYELTRWTLRCGQAAKALGRRAKRVESVQQQQAHSLRQRRRLLRRVDRARTARRRLEGTAEGSGEAAAGDELGAESRQWLGGGGARAAASRAPTGGEEGEKSAKWMQLRALERLEGELEEMLADNAYECAALSEEKQGAVEAEGGTSEATEADEPLNEGRVDGRSEAGSGGRDRWERKQKKGKKERKQKKKERKERREKKDQDEEEQEAESSGGGRASPSAAVTLLFEEQDVEGARRKSKASVASPACRRAEEQVSWKGMLLNLHQDASLSGRLSLSLCPPSPPFAASSVNCSASAPSTDKENSGNNSSTVPVTAAEATVGEGQKDRLPTVLCSSQFAAAAAESRVVQHVGSESFGEVPAYGACHLQAVRGIGVHGVLALVRCRAPTSSPAAPVFTIERCAAVDGGNAPKLASICVNGKELPPPAATHPAVMPACSGSAQVGRDLLEQAQHAVELRSGDRVMVGIGSFFVFQCGMHTVATTLSSASAKDQLGYQQPPPRLGGAGGASAGLADGAAAGLESDWPLSPPTCQLRPLIGDSEGWKTGFQRAVREVEERRTDFDAFAAFYDARPQRLRLQTGEEVAALQQQLRQAEAGGAAKDPSGAGGKAAGLSGGLLVRLERAARRMQSLTGQVKQEHAKALQMEARFYLCCLRVRQCKQIVRELGLQGVVDLNMDVALQGASAGKPGGAAGKEADNQGHLPPELRVRITHLPAGLPCAPTAPCAAPRARVGGWLDGQAGDSVEEGQTYAGRGSVEGEGKRGEEVWEDWERFEERAAGIFRSCSLWQWHMQQARDGKTAGLQLTGEGCEARAEGGRGGLDMDALVGPFLLHTRRPVRVGCAHVPLALFLPSLSNYDDYSAVLGQQGAAAGKSLARIFVRMDVRVRRSRRAKAGGRSRRLTERRKTGHDTINFSLPSGSSSLWPSSSNQVSLDQLAMQSEEALLFSSDDFSERSAESMDEEEADAAAEDDSPFAALESGEAERLQGALGETLELPLFITKLEGIEQSKWTRLWCVYRFYREAPITTSSILCQQRPPTPRCPTAAVPLFLGHYHAHRCRVTPALLSLLRGPSSCCLAPSHLLEEEEEEEEERERRGGEAHEEMPLGQDGIAGIGSSRLGIGGAGGCDMLIELWGLPNLSRTQSVSQRLVQAMTQSSRLPSSETLGLTSTASPPFSSLPSSHPRPTPPLPSSDTALISPTQGPLLAPAAGEGRRQRGRAGFLLRPRSLSPARSRSLMKRGPPTKERGRLRLSHQDGVSSESTDSAVQAPLFRAQSSPQPPVSSTGSQILPCSSSRGTTQQLLHAWQRADALAAQLATQSAQVAAAEESMLALLSRELALHSSVEGPGTTSVVTRTLGALLEATAVAPAPLGQPWSGLQAAVATLLDVAQRQRHDISHLRESGSGSGGGGALASSKTRAVVAGERARAPTEAQLHPQLQMPGWALLGGELGERGALENTVGRKRAKQNKAKGKRDLKRPGAKQGGKASHTVEAANTTKKRFAVREHTLDGISSNSGEMALGSWKTERQQLKEELAEAQRGLEQERVRVEELERRNGRLEAVYEKHKQLVRYLKTKRAQKQHVQQRIEEDAVDMGGKAKIV